MLPDRVSNPGPLTYESGALPIALRGPASWKLILIQLDTTKYIDGVGNFQFWGVLPIWIIELIMLASGGVKEVP